MFSCIRLLIMVIAVVTSAGQAFADYNVTISSAASANGSWSNGTPDVWTPSVAGSNVSVADIQTRLAAGVTITTAGGGAENGDIVVNDAVSWSADTTFSLSAYRNVNVNASLTATGNTAGLVLAPNIGLGGGGYSLNNGAVITLSGSTPSLTIAGNAYTVINSVNALQDMRLGLSGKYALGSSIDASATSTWNSNAGFEPVGYLGDANYTTTNFTGAFDGLGHTITGLTINRPAEENVGLFGLTFIGATIKNVGLIGGSVTGSVNIGGLAGNNNGGIITNAYNTGSVSGSNSVGGLVGYSRGGGTITNSYSTGVVSGGNTVGGLAGTNSNNATITNSYSTGSASGGDYVGGLVGSHEWGTISYSYSTGAVSGSGANVGGLVGIKGGAATISSSYWDTQTSGQAGGSFGTGLTTAQMMAQANFTSWDFTNTWWMSEGNTRPFLSTEYSTTITNAHQLQLMGMNATTLASSYTLAADINMAELSQASGLWNITTGFLPVGDATTPFTGAFDGLGQTITGLTINRPATNFIGLFGRTSSSTISNVGLVGGSVTGTSFYIGGLVGHNNAGTITNSYSTCAVSGGTGNEVGGLVGYNNGTITNSYSTGSVTAGSVNAIGGLVGNNDGNIATSYSTGAVIGNVYVGGLTGIHRYGTITTSYSTGVVSGNGNVGGLVGLMYDGGTAINSYWDTETSGQATSAGGTGKTTAEMLQQANFISWDFTNTWRIYPGHTYPLLKSFLTPLTITADNVSKIYDGIAYISALTNPGYSVVGADTSGHLFNTANPYNSATEVGSYTPDLYSDQQGYDISYVNGTLTIDPADTTPNAFSFTDQTNVAINATVESNAILVTGINFSSPISISNCTGILCKYSVSSDGGANWSAYSTTTPATVTLNDRVKMQVTSSSSPSTVVTATLTIGMVSADFNVTTNEYPVKRISSSIVYHMTIQESYNAAELSGDIIQVLATTPFGGGLTCDRPNVSVTIQGGFDSGFGANPGFTIINTGIMTISHGEVTVDRIWIE